MPMKPHGGGGGAMSNADLLDLWRWTFGHPVNVAPLVTPVYPTGGAGAWNYGNWLEFVASTAVDMRLSTIVSAFEAATDGVYQASIGVGAAGSEIEVGTTSGASLTINYTGNVDIISSAIIPAGSRVAIRLAGPTGGGQVRLGMNGLSQSADPGLTSAQLVTDLMGRGNGASFTIPNLADGIRPASGGGGAWTYGNYSQFIASTPTKCYIASVLVDYDTGSGTTSDMEITIGVGAAGAEVEVATLFIGRQASAAYNTIQIPITTVPIASGSRLAVKIATSALNNGKRLKLICSTLP